MITVKSLLESFNGKHTELDKAADSIQDLINTQVTDPVVKRGDEGEYFRGLANGLIVAKAVVDGEDPNFLNPDGSLEKGKDEVTEGIYTYLESFCGKLNDDIEDVSLAKVWYAYKQGNTPGAGKRLLQYLDAHPEEAKDIADRSREIVKQYKKLYRVGDNTGLSWTPDKNVLKDYFPDEYESGLYTIKVTKDVLDRVIGHEDVFPYNVFTKHTPETEVLLWPESNEEE